MTTKRKQRKRTQRTPKFSTELVEIKRLTPHPQNYREHTPDQIEHLVASLRKRGFYKNIVIARDDVILAGHGIVQAASSIGLHRVPVVRLDLDSNEPEALEVLTGDNEVARRAVIDDRLLTELLRRVRDDPKADLLGTGYDAEQLAALAFVTRPASEIADFDAAKEWVGMPDFERAPEQVKMMILFRSEADRKRFVEEKGIEVSYVRGKVRTAWWPARPRQDLESIRFQDDDTVPVASS